MRSQRHNKTSLLRFAPQLLSWYDTNKRDLPWRRTEDPYRIWISEIMLQQTRVAAVIAHYHEFLRRFPTVQKLAAARESSVLAAWSGLGYYRRARMLHAAAKVIARERKGTFPQTSADWRELPGIGRYTAAAIASIAFGEPIAVVDGNVERLLQRLLGRQLNGDEVWQWAGELLDRTRPGDFNQAMMELGATVCTPKSPSCLLCPIVDLCVTRGDLPSKTVTEGQTKREIHYALHRRGQSVFLVQRPSHVRLMADMWELPEIAAPGAPATPDFTVRHSITVTDYTVHIWHRAAREASEGQWFTPLRAAGLPLTGLAREILRRAKVLL